MVNIQSLMRALPRHGLEPSEIALIMDIPGLGGFSLWLYEPPCGLKEPFINVEDFMMRVLRYRGVTLDEARSQTHRAYARLRQSIDIFARPVLYDAGGEGEEETIPVSMGLPFLLENGIINEEVSQFLSLTAEVARNAALFEDPDNWRIRHKLIDLPDVPLPKQLIEFVPWGPWTSGPDRETEAWLRWREEMRPVAKHLKEKLGEEVYYFADLNDEYDDDFTHRFLVLHWLCTYKPESAYVRYLMETSGAVELEELKATLLDENSYIYPHAFAMDGTEVYFPRITYHPPKQHRVGVVFSTRASLSVAGQIIASQIGSFVTLAAPYELLRGTDGGRDLCGYEVLKDSLQFVHTHDEIYLQDGEVDQPITFLSGIDELYVVENIDITRGWLKVEAGIKELLWMALCFGLPEHYFANSGSKLLNPEVSLEEDGIPERVSQKEQQRKAFTESLKELRVSPDWSSSGLWSEGAMISYDAIDIPFPLIRRIAAWQHDFDATLDVSVSGGSDNAWEEAHDREAFEIGRELRRILKPSIPVWVKQGLDWKIVEET